MPLSGDYVTLTTLYILFMYLQFCLVINRKATEELSNWFFSKPIIAKSCLCNFFNNYEKIVTNLGSGMAQELLESLEEASYLLSGLLDSDLVMHQEITGSDNGTYSGNREINVLTYTDRYCEALSLVDLFNNSYNTFLCHNQLN